MGEDGMSEERRDEIELGSESVAESAVAPAAATSEPDEAGVVDGPRGVRLTGRRKGSPRRRAMVLPATTDRTGLTPEQRLLILDAWRRSGLTAQEFGTIVQVSCRKQSGWTKPSRCGLWGLKRWIAVSAG